MAINIKRANGTTTPAIASEIIQIKTDLSLDAVNNTADSAKPVSTAVAAALGNYAITGHGHPFSILTGQPTDNTALALALSYKADGTATASALAAKVAIAELKTVNGVALTAAGGGNLVIAGGGTASVWRGDVATQAAMLALATVNVGDWVIRTDLNQRFDLIAAGQATLTNWKALPGSGGAAPQNSLSPASAVLAPAVDAVNAALALKADYLAPGIITSATTLIRSPTGGATNGFNRVQYCVVTVPTTVTVTGAQAQVGDFVPLNNENPASTAVVTMAGVTARAGYTLDAAPGSIVEALCVAAGSFQAATPIPVVGGGGPKVSSFDQPSFFALPRTGNASAASALLSTGWDLTAVGTIYGPTRAAGLRTSIDRSGYYGATAANSDAGISSNNTFYIFEDRPAVIEIVFAVGDILGVGTTTAVGFSVGPNCDPSATGDLSKFMLGNDQASGQLKIYSSDGVAAAPTVAIINGGTGFPCNDKTVMYKFNIAYFPTGPRRVIWTVTNLLSSVVATGTITATAAIPSALQPMSLFVRRNSRTLAAEAIMEIMNIRAGAYV